MTSDKRAASLCPVCGDEFVEFAHGTVLGHVDVVYRRCRGCQLIALPDPDWLDEAYSKAISALDVGLLTRCHRLARQTARIIRAERLTGGRFLDWAGGYGTLTRMLRNEGFDFRHWDPYCDNILAVGLEGDPNTRYDLVTAFEVVEHLARPVEALTDVARNTDRLLFTTYLLPDPPPLPGAWWYYAPESGQHITFHTRHSLETLADRLECRLATDGVQLHMFYRGHLRRSTRTMLSRTAARLRVARGLLSLQRQRLVGRSSLADADVAAAAARIEHAAHARSEE